MAVKKSVTQTDNGQWQIEMQDIFGKTKLHLYDSLLAEHLTHERQVAFIIGPRQIGSISKTTHIPRWFLPKKLSQLL